MDYVLDEIDRLGQNMDQTNVWIEKDNFHEIETKKH